MSMFPCGLLVHALKSYFTNWSSCTLWSATGYRESIKYLVMTSNQAILRYFIIVVRDPPGSLGSIGKHSCRLRFVLLALPHG